jgi:hypothetical protein
MGLAACALFSSGPAQPTTAGKLRPTCPDAELDACIAEGVTVVPQTLPGLDASEAAALQGDRRPVPVRCILRETGVIESCHVLDPRGTPYDEAIDEWLQRRRYAPVTYKGRPVLVPYTFLVSFTPPPAEVARTSGVRIAVFRALLARLRGPVIDAGAAARPLVCVGIGDDVADPPRTEMEALARAGAQVEPASSCWGLMQTVGGAAPFGSVVVRDVRFESPDVAEVLPSWSVIQDFSPPGSSRCRAGRGSPVPMPAVGGAPLPAQPLSAEAGPKEAEGESPGGPDTAGGSRRCAPEGTGSLPAGSSHSAYAGPEPPPEPDRALLSTGADEEPVADLEPGPSWTCPERVPGGSLEHGAVAAPR